MFCINIEGDCVSDFRRISFNTGSLSSGMLPATSGTLVREKAAGTVKANTNGNTDGNSCQRKSLWEDKSSTIGSG